MDRYICIHGHFYQPPRENPWLDDIEVQDSAYPYHDWNERITAECYAPNTVSRIIDGEGRIVNLTNNYARISFNFGPTLLAWLELKAPETYQAILTADRMSQQNFSGHGSALAQPYNHMIMPLANSRDKYTQILWGLRDFEHRFQRAPEGMWLPETAVDLETLDIMAELGIQFTILAPHQAKQVRLIGQDGSWVDVSQGSIDPTVPYEINLPSGRRMAAFFYDGPISRAVAFEGLLSRGENLAQRLAGAFSAEGQFPQLVHIATDGETYGHHQRFGDMALTYALQYIESEKLARLTNYGEYLNNHTPLFEAEIFENTSWSCAHGVERWWKDCGCNSGGHPGWSQAWRTPLRETLDWLRDTLAPLFEEKAGQYLKDPWAARNDYIRVILERTPENQESFLNRHASRELSDGEKVTVFKLMGMQRCTQLMYTSCGWFFDELSGIETVQVILYAGRALRLMQDIGGDEIEAGFLERLEQAKSNIPEHGDGRQIYEKIVKPTMLDLERVGAHYAVSSVFQEYPKQARIYCYTVDQEAFQLSEVGNAKLAVGRVRITSEITREATTLDFGVLHFGEQNLCAGVKGSQPIEDYETMVREVAETFGTGEFPETIHRLDRHYGACSYSLRSLFRDEQRRVLNQIMEASMEGTRFVYRKGYDAHLPFMRFLTDLGIPLPEPLPCSARFVLNDKLRQFFEQPEIDSEDIQNALSEARVLKVQLDEVSLEFTIRRTVERLAAAFREKPDEFNCLRQLAAAVSLVRTMPFEARLWEVQNIYFEMIHTALPEWRWKAEHGEAAAHDWVATFLQLGQDLSVNVE
jgi:alpha-amylase/alpha-mannosidase (GH57 family)